MFKCANINHDSFTSIKHAIYRFHYLLFLYFHITLSFSRPFDYNYENFDTKCAKGALKTPNGYYMITTKST